MSSARAKSLGICFTGWEDIPPLLGETWPDGAGARPMRQEWVLSIRDQCERAQVPFFFKQWGGVRKSKAGRDLEGRKYDGLPGRVELPVLGNNRRLAAIAEIEGLYRATNRASEAGVFPEQQTLR